MVVDDEEFCLSSMRAIMTSIGIDTDFQVDFCISGLEALDHFNQAFELGINYKLVIMDFSMPEISGIETTAKIFEKMKEFKVIDLPVVIGCTGHVQEHYRREGEAAGMSQILTKPLYVPTLRKILNSHNMI